MRKIWIAAIVLLLVAYSAVAPATAQDQRCFPETNQCISGRIREFWEQNGGLSVFGFPITDQHEEILENKPFQLQWFERNRLELHPENQRPYDVLLGRLGADRLAQQSRDPFTFPKSEAQPGCRFFAETGHNACGDILAAWRASGLEIDGVAGKSEGENLALFGLPLSDMQTEQLEGIDYQVQWFERARFELHPENQPPYNVLLGLLGNEIRANAAPSQNVAPVQPTAKPLPAPSYNECRPDPDPSKAPNEPVAIVGIDKRAEIVTLKNVSAASIDLTGWHMCSITGNQHHPIDGTLAPGEQRGFPSADGSTWNNSESDPGALYNPQGQLVSYWPR